MSMEVYILSGSRTPLGSFLGQLSTVPATELGAVAITSAVKQAQINPNEVEEVLMGNVFSAGLGQAPARQAAIKAGLPSSVPCTTINKVCGSGLKAIITAAQTIQTGDNNLVIAGGMENMSLSPHVMNLRNGQKWGTAEFKDSMQFDGLTDAYNGQPMGACAEECVRLYGVTRQEQDNFAIQSFQRSQQASKDGKFKAEIAPVSVKAGKNTTLVSEDEGPFKANFDKIPQLKPVFLADGTITAANASTINDGAAAVVLGGSKYKDKAKFKIISYAQFAHDPVFFTTAPVGAMNKCLQKAKLTIQDIDIFEINEAFAVVTLAAMKEFKLSPEKVNVWGGAVSLGHPIGASGARILVTLINILEQLGKKRGMASICIGGGEALAMIIEKV
ncbi:MAG: thiolase family protein [Pseudomonadota bacterium]